MVILTLSVHAVDLFIVQVFIQAGSSLRLSSLLRLMLSSSDAMMFTDAAGRIVHANAAWALVTGYDLSTVQGQTCSLLHGAATDKDVIRLSSELLQQLVSTATASARETKASTTADATADAADANEAAAVAPSSAQSFDAASALRSAVFGVEQSCCASRDHVQMSVINYRKDGTPFFNRVTIVPIRGGYMTSGEQRRVD